MRKSGIVKLLVILIFVITLTACSKTKPDNNLERLWEALIARDIHTSEHLAAVSGTFIEGHDDAQTS